MKKLLALICMITCILGLTGCGSEAEVSSRDQMLMDDAMAFSKAYLIPMCVSNSQDALLEQVETFTYEEIEFFYETNEELPVYLDGYAFVSALNSFNSAIDIIGTVNKDSIGEATAEIDGNQIIVQVQIKGEKKDAIAELILSKDSFLKLESAALNPVETMGDLMKKAALNTLIGMGTVFGVLILIIFVISAFNLIPKVQKWFDERKEKKVEATGIDNAVAQIEQQESEELADDLELVAVIAAAVAAYEGSASTDGFVVRSIRKARR